MDDVSVTIPQLDVPYFKQTRTATCGPVCIMMVMKYIDRSFEFSRRVEFQLWRKSYSLFLFGGTFQFGLAKTAATLGFHSEIYQKARFSAYHSKIPRLYDLEENIVSSRARHAMIPIHYGVDVIKVISDSLQQKIPPIVFLNLKPIVGENVFHWVVVTGMDQQNVYMNDPYVPEGFPMKMKKGYPVVLDVFHMAIATDIGRNLRLPPCVVVVYK